MTVPGTSPNCGKVAALAADVRFPDVLLQSIRGDPPARESPKRPDTGIRGVHKRPLAV